MGQSQSCGPTRWCGQYGGPGPSEGQRAEKGERKQELSVDGGHWGRAQSLKGPGSAGGGS